MMCLAIYEVKIASWGVAISLFKEDTENEGEWVCYVISSIIVRKYGNEPARYLTWGGGLGHTMDCMGRRA